MNPFYFGTSANPLFGVHHPPTALDTGHAVLLCYPVGNEYLRAHRAFRQLTSLLVRAGAHVLRFDYRGTGDSWGDPADATVDRWLEDIDTAIDELKDSSGLDRVSLAGLRFGATLGARAAFRRDDVDHVVLWDPVADGSAWFDSLIALEPNSRDRLPGEGSEPAFASGTIGLAGFPFTPELQQGVRGLRLSDLSPAPSVAVDVLTSTEEPEVRALVESWKSHRGPDSAPVGYRCIPSAGDWAVADRFGSALIPQAIIQGVVRCLTQG